MKKIAEVDPKHYMYLKPHLKMYFDQIDKNFKELENRIKKLESHLHIGDRRSNKKLNVRVEQLKK